MPKGYYNENNHHSANTLRNLIKLGAIPYGDVDTRSIEDVKPNELAGYTQCHFFAGLGGWSLALRAAGWPDHKPVWTGSCPCQPFSTAGERDGFADERHLWPYFHYLIEQCRPRVVMGEQVESPLALSWIDLVSLDLEAAGYAFGSLNTPAAGFGAPHIRQRLYWIGLRGYDRQIATLSSRWRDRAEAGILGDPERTGLQRQPRHGKDGKEKESGRIDAQAGGSVAAADDALPAGPCNGFWSGSDWIGCQDGKFRPVEPGTSPVADGDAFDPGSGSTFEGKDREGILRGYGNAIVVPQAAEIIRAMMPLVWTPKDMVLEIEKGRSLGDVFRVFGNRGVDYDAMRREVD